MSKTAKGVAGAAHRETRPYVAQKAICWPLLRAYQWAESEQLCRWPQVEEGFLAGLWEFDQGLIADHASKRSNQAEKSGFLVDIITLLLTTCSDKKLYRRRVVPGLFFAMHALDAAYPATGSVEVMVSAKESSVQRRGPRESLDEWMKETSFKTIDLKAEWARNAGQGGGPTSDLVTWLRQSKPLSFLFLAIRVVDTSDLDHTLFLANAANQMLDGVGLVAYKINPLGNSYQACKIPPTWSWTGP